MAARRTGQPGRAKIVGSVAAIALILPALAQTAPVLVAQYGSPKAEFREAARYVAGNSPPGSTVVVIGAVGTSLLPPFVREAVAYYYELYEYPVSVMEGTRLDQTTLDRVDAAGADMWAAVFTGPQPADLESARAAGLEVRPFHSVTMARLPRDSERHSAGTQALALLRWSHAFYPALASTRAVFDPEFARAGLGDDLLRNSGQSPDGLGWDTGQGASLEEGGEEVVLAPAELDASATLRAEGIVEGRVYTLSFHCGTEALRGELRVYVETVGASGEQLETLPEAYGYLCANDPAMPRQATAFRASNGATALRLRIIANGTGTARFGELELREVLTPDP